MGKTTIMASVLFRLDRSFQTPKCDGVHGVDLNFCLDYVLMLVALFDELDFSYFFVIILTFQKLSHFIVIPSSIFVFTSSTVFCITGS